MMRSLAGTLLKTYLFNEILQIFSCLTPLQSWIVQLISQSSLFTPLFFQAIIMSCIGQIQIQCLAQSHFPVFFYWQQSLNLCSLSLCSSIRHLCLYPPGKTTSPTLPPPRRWVSASSFTPLTCHLKSPLPAAAISFLLKWWIAAEKKEEFQGPETSAVHVGLLYIYILN